MKRIIAAIAFMLIAASVLAFSTRAHAATCTLTGFYRDGINLTAAQIGGNVTGTLDATGCDIGVYYGPNSNNTVSNAEIFGARYFGVVNRKGQVDVTNSYIHNTGNTPFDGTQHGVDIYYASVDTGSATAQPACEVGSTTGTIDSNKVSAYQKGGIVVNCSGVNVTVTNNTVTGLGPVNFIAQNGIQVSRGAGGVVSDNTISDNFYTGEVGVGPNPGGQNPEGFEFTSGGLLLFQAGNVQHNQNHFSGNQRNLEMVP